VVKDICGLRFEQTRQLMDHPGPDPAARAAADVKRLLAQAPHLRRIVEVAEAAAGGEDPSATGREPEPPGDDQYSG